MNYERLNDITFWFQLGQQAYHVGCKLGAIRVTPLSLAWSSWREGWLTEHDKNKGRLKNK